MRLSVGKLLVIGASLCLSACGSMATRPLPQEMNQALLELTGQDGRACIRISEISGYASLSDSLLSVTTIRKSHALMVTNHRCPALESTSAAVFDGQFTQICGGNRDFIVVVSERCSVRSIFKFDDRQAALDAIDAAEQRIKAGRDNASS